MAVTDMGFNVKTITFIPADGGGTVSIDHVTNLTRNNNAEFVDARGDDDLYAIDAQVAGMVMSIDVTTLDAATVNTLTAGDEGTLKWTEVNPEYGGSDRVYTIANARFGGDSGQNGKDQYAERTISFRGWSTDGTTDPVAVA